LVISSAPDAGARFQADFADNLSAGKMFRRRDLKRPTLPLALQRRGGPLLHGADVRSGPRGTRPEPTSNMLESLKNFLSELSGGGKQQDRFEEDDYRLAAAALLVHVSTIDGDLSQAERDRLHDVLKFRFALDEAGTARLIDAAIAADREAVDLYHFTHLINRALDEDGRRRMVEMMWEIVFADGQCDEFEDNIVWRAADLLGISSRDRIELRQRVAAERGGAGSA
jgi:uncharacterized tellurite resistance protein B-like protein